MSWTTLSVPDPVNPTPWATASVREKKGVCHVHVYFSERLLTKYAKPPVCKVQYGDGEDAGKLMIEFITRPDDASSLDRKHFHPLKKVLKCNAKITLPLFEPCPKRTTISAACEVVEFGEGHVVLALPLEAWKVGSVVHNPRPRAPEPAVTNGGPVGKLDAIHYLKSKGHSVRRNAAGHLVIDDVLADPARVLRMVNACRSTSNLPNLNPADIRIA